MSARAPRGGPTVGQTKELCMLLRAGAPLALACTQLGVTERTVRLWLSKGRSCTPSRYTAFRAAVEAARAAFHADVEAMLRARLCAPPDEGGPDAYH